MLCGMNQRQKRISAERLGFLDAGEGLHHGGPHRIHVALPGRT